MSVLSAERRKDLEKACVQGRRAAEAACRAAAGSLALLDERPPGHLSESDRDLRRGLRAKRQQLGDEGDRIDLLVADCAYEQWHRLLFARFLAENGLLIHPEYRAPVTLEECEELATDLGEPDGWAVAGRFAAEILPGIFRLGDPCVRVRLASEGRLALEQIVASLSAEVFVAGDALGWVYQFWQKEKKDEVNASERKIGGADIAPLTQLFTENYMVRFLLENSLGAWWASRHPESPLVETWGYLRVDDDGRPAAGEFDGWPTKVAAVTVMDPCCGSGHFLVEAFGMLWRMRAEEEGLAPVAAQDAVLSDNLFGLELDPRCVQIGMFAVALTAWRSGGGWRELPVPNIACSGTPVKAEIDAWKELGGGDQRLENALGRLHLLFRNADTLGSLIDPKREVEISGANNNQKSLDSVAWHELSSMLESASKGEVDDPAASVLGADAAGLARAADFLSRPYTLVVTNVPYLKRAKQSDVLASFCDRYHPDARQDLAFAILDRIRRLSGGQIAVVLPHGWLFMSWYKAFRQRWLKELRWDLIAHLGPGAFGSIGGEVVNVLLAHFSRTPHSDHTMATLDIDHVIGPSAKADALRLLPVGQISQAAQLQNPDAKVSLEELSDLPLLAQYATGFAGVQTGDYPRFGRLFWELPSLSPSWSLQQSTVSETATYDGREHALYWQGGTGELVRFVRERLGEGKEGAWIRGTDFRGRRGVAVSSMSQLPVSLYDGDLFDNNTAVILPHDASDLPAIWAFASSPEFAESVRRIDTSIKVTNATFVKVPFDIERWREVAEKAGPLPDPWSADPTQWLFLGRPEVASEPLQAAVGRLLGYSWPKQGDADDLDELADADGIACLPSVLGEQPAATRVRELLARSFGGTWSPARAAALLAESGSKKENLESWLRGEFFKAHCQVFRNRPFIWHVWDGRNDGFAALVNYHRLDRPTLERLTYTYLGDWIERQTAAVREDVAGAAEDRLVAARELQRRLELILAGEPPHDIYVRWKSLAEQPIGWDPDFNDGVRLNVRPFVQAEVLRSKFNVKWDKDRGKNPDGAERLNNLHLTIAEKQAARAGSRP